MLGFPGAFRLNATVPSQVRFEFPHPTASVGTEGVNQHSRRVTRDTYKIIILRYTDIQPIPREETGGGTGGPDEGAQPRN